MLNIVLIKNVSHPFFIVKDVGPDYNSVGLIYQSILHVAIDEKNHLIV